MDDTLSERSTLSVSRDSTKLSSAHRDLVKTLRRVENRLCADCDAPISQSHYASCVHGVWICKDCAEVHTNVLGYNVKSSKDEWTEEELEIITSQSNLKVNASLERYIPSGWTKCTPNSTMSHREIWIQAKYDSKLFVIPNTISSMPATPNNSTEQTSLSSEINILPPRLLDFFLSVSVGQCTDFGSDFSLISVDSINFNPQITSCLPGLNHYKDTPIPSHLGSFVFPQGVHLSSEEIAPYFFTFVLTDVSAVKLYGGVLQIYELIEPEEVAALLGHPPGSPLLPQMNLVYMPKSLVLLSHYPFYNLFRCSLEQIYRISLSSSPLPMERYISNLLQVPLPPHGCIEVSYCSLADCTLTISRPPKNQLPMVDFSYRPLFTCLSVDNILLIFSYLMYEHKICFASDSIALLTPIQEAFLSLFFPFVWQGAYIPVLPSHMLDIVDAPVPLMVGINRSEYPNFGADDDSYPQGVVTVDIDNDHVHVGTDDHGHRLQPITLPPREASKLKSKLVEFGACIHRVNVTETLGCAGISFPRNEHLVPIKTFFTEDGVMLNHFHGSQSITLADTKVQIPYQSTISSAHTKSVLSPANNANTRDGFDAKEIRYAFLRFFLSIFRDFQQYMSQQETTGNQKEKQKKRTSNGVMGKFSRDSYLTAHSGSFFANLVDTQMFTKFAEEREALPDEPEIKFFDECIIDKLNRSKTTLSKSTTPFLDDRSDAVQSTFIPVQPSKHAIPPNAKYVYPRFPQLKSELVASFRPPRQLQRGPEKRRLFSTSAQMLALGQSVERTARRRSFTLSENAVVNILAHSKARYNQLDTAVTQFKSYIRMKPIRLQYKCSRRACIVIQRAYRRWRIWRLNEQYNELQHKLLRRIQTIARRYVAQQMYKRLKRSAITAQALWRMIYTKKWLAARRKKVTLLQALYRGRCQRRRYQSILHALVIIQARIKTHLVCKKYTAIQLSLQQKLRKILFMLWKASNTPLEYRSKFWRALSGSGFFSICVYREEVSNLWKMLKYNSSVVDNIQGDLSRLVSNVDDLMIAAERQTTNTHESPALAAERTSLYDILKRDPSKVKDRFFEAFSIQGDKKRKRNLTSTLLWRDLERADASADIVLDIITVTSQDLVRWKSERTATRMQRNLADVVRACMHSVRMK